MQMNIDRPSSLEMGIASLLGEKAAQKFNSGFTVLNVWFPDISSARRIESSRNFERSDSVSILKSTKGQVIAELALTAIGEEGQVNAILSWPRNDERVDIKRQFYLLPGSGRSISMNNYRQD